MAGNYVVGHTYDTTPSSELEVITYDLVVKLVCAEGIITEKL